MATARKLIIDESVSGIYHCFSRCVRQAYLLAPENQLTTPRNESLPTHERPDAPTDSDLHAQEFETTIRVDDHRRKWIMGRLETLAEIFAIDCISVAIMSNHMHLLLRNLPEVVREWSDVEVAYRWFMLHPAQKPKEFRRSRGTLFNEEELQVLIGYQDQIAEWRKRLSSISWYMKELKEPIARQANAEDRVTGAFWEGRFKSYRVRDNLGLLVCASYIDCNPVTADICESPFAASFTSIELHVNRMERAGNREIRALWKKCAENPEVHGYEDPDEDLDAFIEQFDDAEFLPALPARRSAYGIADSWLPPGYVDKSKESSFRQLKNGETTSAAGESDRDLSDLQTPTSPPLEALPMMDMRSYMRRLRSLAKLRKEARDEVIAKSAGSMKVQARHETLRRLKNEMHALAVRTMNDLDAQLAERHASTPTSPDARECDKRRLSKLREQTMDMVERTTTRFELDCIAPNSRTLQLLPAGIKLWEPAAAMKYGT